MSNFKTLLDEQYAWPSEYLFKFIVPESELEIIEGIFVEIGGKTEKRPSRNGRYVSVSSKILMQSSDEVLVVYERVRAVKGVISL